MVEERGSKWENAKSQILFDSYPTIGRLLKDRVISSVG